MICREEITKRANDVFVLLDFLPEAELVEALNDIRAALHEKSPFKSEPVDFLPVGCDDWTQVMPI